MSSDTEPTDDPITSAFLSGSAYERLRIQRPTFFTQPIPRKLTLQSGLLGALALLLPVYLLYPDPVLEYLPAGDPPVASPKVVILGLIGAGIELFAATLLVGAALYRIRYYPLSETQARTILTVEDFSSYLGFGTGGLAIGITILYFLLGVAGGTAVQQYIDAMNGVNPFAASGIGLSVAELAMLAFVAAISLMTVRLYLGHRLVDLQTE
jgi:hypothetical protein